MKVDTFYNDGGVVIERTESVVINQLPFTASSSNSLVFQTKADEEPASNAETKEADGMDFSHLPAALRSPNAKMLWRKLFEVGYVGATCITTRSFAESAIMASAIARKLGMKRYWDFFSQIWEMPNLRSYLSKCMDSDSLYDFTVEVDKMLGLPPKAGLKPRICQDS